MPETFNLPDGSMTESENVYVGTWRKFADRVAGLLGGDRMAYDPGLTVRLAGGQLLEMNAVAAGRINEVALVVAEVAEALELAAGCHDDPCAHISEIREGPCDCSLPERTAALEKWDELRGEKV